MKRKLWPLFFLLCLPLCLPLTAQAADKTVGTAELIDRAAAYDGQTISFEGEAVGDLLPRGDSVWVNVSDGSNSALGVFVPAAEAQKIHTLGRYGVTGDRLRITGVFHRACAAHGGDMDLHAVTLEVLPPGRAALPPLPRWLPPLAAISCLSAAVLCTAAALAVRRSGARPRKN